MDVIVRVRCRFPAAGDVLFDCDGIGVGVRFVGGPDGAADDVVLGVGTIDGGGDDTLEDGSGVTGGITVDVAFGTADEAFVGKGVLVASLGVGVAVEGAGGEVGAGLTRIVRVFVPFRRGTFVTVCLRLSVLVLVGLRFSVRVFECLRLTGVRVFVRLRFKDRVFVCLRLSVRVVVRLRFRVRVFVRFRFSVRVLVRLRFNVRVLERV
jgi:hypothetical protein